MPCNLSSQTLPEKPSRRPNSSGRWSFTSVPALPQSVRFGKKDGKALDGYFIWERQTRKSGFKGSWNANSHPEIMVLMRHVLLHSSHGTFGDTTRRLARHADARTNRQVDIQPPDTSLTSLARADTPDGHQRVAHSRGSSRTGKNLPSEARGDGCRYAPRQPGNPALHRVPGRIGARNRARRCQTPRGS